jgi:GDP-mannose transporter
MRSNVSATAGVVVGVVCKIGSVLLNLLIWDQHASPIQMCFLAMGLAGGSLFQQAPMRAAAKAAGSNGKAHASSPQGGSSSAPPEAVAAIATAAAGGNGGKTAHKRESRLSTTSTPRRVTEEV